MTSRTHRERVAHLLRRAGLGASRAEVSHYEKLGLEGAVEELLNYERVDEGFDLPIESFIREGRLVPPLVSLWWVVRLLVTRRPLQEKMVLFWHDHFACSGDKVTSGVMMYAQNELFRRLALGNFDTLLLEVCKDPAMIFYLDTHTNVIGRPNENFAREIMELFTMGEGNYTEQDVREVARAFTGWGFRRAPQTVSEDGKLLMATFVKRSRLHDHGAKEILGKRGEFDGEEVCRILVEHPATRKYICTKLWEFFAYSNPEESVILRLSQEFLQSGYSIRALIRHILLSEEFYSDRAYRAIYKSPVDFVIGTARALGVAGMVGQTGGREQRGVLRGLVFARALEQAMSRMGQRLLYPPSVAGWDGGAAWLNSATMVERMKLSDVLFGGTRVRSGRWVPASHLFGDDIPHDSRDAVGHVLEVLDARLPKEKREVLVSELERLGGPVALLDQGRAQEAARVLSRLVFASPEYQFC